MSSPLIQLDPRDNVGVLTRSLEAGASLHAGGRDQLLPAALGLGHKIALLDISPGEKILKYGAAIGSATTAIRAGEHVHLHNMQSDYLPTYTLDEGRKYEH